MKMLQYLGTGWEIQLPVPLHALSQPPTWRAWAGDMPWIQATGAKTGRKLSRKEQVTRDAEL